MKILYYSPHPNIKLNDNTGYGTHMREVIASMEEHGCEVVHLINGDMNEMNNHANASRQNGKHKKRVKRAIPRLLWETMKDISLLRKDRKYEKRLFEYVRKIQPDVIYERGNYLQLSGINIAKYFAIPHILEMNNPFVENRINGSVRSIIAKYATAIEKKQLTTSTYITVVSSALKEYFVDKYKINEAKIIVTPMGISPHKIYIDQKKVEDIKIKYDLKSNIVIGFVGSLHTWHGLELLLDAFKEIVKSNDRVRLLIVGGGYIIEELKKRSEQNGISDYTYFTSWVPNSDVYNYIENMDITVLPNSHWYGSPVKIFEYGVMGKPIIAPNISTVTESMVDGVDGILINPETNELVAALNNLIADSSLRVRLGKTFQHKVYRNYTWSTITKHVLDNIKL